MRKKGEAPVGGNRQGLLGETQLREKFSVDKHIRLHMERKLQAVRERQARDIRRAQLLDDPEEKAAAIEKAFLKTNEEIEDACSMEDLPVTPNFEIERFVHSLNRYARASRSGGFRKAA